MSEKPELLSVTQEDREAAAALAEQIAGPTNGKDQIAWCRAGLEDSAFLVQAFARHRPQATARPSLCHDDAGLVQRLGFIVPYLVWTIGPESPGHHPTMPSAVAAFRGALEELRVLSNRAGSKDGLDRNASVFEFLLGEGPLDGCHFGEKPEGERGNFWWRRHLREALSEGSKDGGREILAVRPEVAAFALLMERELRANDHKPGWKDDDPADLARRVGDEAGELSNAVQKLKRIVWAPHDGRSGGWMRNNPQTGAPEVGVGYEDIDEPALTEQRAKVASEAADVANMAMMVADVCGALKPAVDHGEGPIDYCGINQEPEGG